MDWSAAEQEWPTWTDWCQGRYLWRSRSEKWWKFPVAIWSCWPTWSSSRSVTCSSRRWLCSKWPSNWTDGQDCCSGEWFITCCLTVISRIYTYIACRFWISNLHRRGPCYIVGLYSFTCRLQVLYTLAQSHTRCAWWWYAQAGLCPVSWQEYKPCDLLYAYSTRFSTRRVQVSVFVHYGGDQG